MNPDAYDLLIDPRAVDTTSEKVRTELPVLDLPADCQVADAAVALEAVFADDAALTAALLVVGDSQVGVSSRDRLVNLGSVVLRSAGDGEGATLPGASLRYRIVRFRCAACEARVRRIHVDPRATPQCTNGHGDLELEPER
jgi:hypothetical protein